jgi:hypothetical protein
MIDEMLADVETMTGTTNHGKVCTPHYAIKLTRWLTSIKSATGHVHHLGMTAAKIADEIAHHPESRFPAEIVSIQTGRMTPTDSAVAILL